MRARVRHYLAKPYLFRGASGAFLERLAAGRPLARLSCCGFGDLEPITVGRTCRGRTAAPPSTSRILLLAHWSRPRRPSRHGSDPAAGRPPGDYEFRARGNIVDMHLQRLRKKVDEACSHPLISNGRPSAPATLSASLATPTQPDQPPGLKSIHSRGSMLALRRDRRRVPSLTRSGCLSRCGGRVASEGRRCLINGLIRNDDNATICPRTSSSSSAGPPLSAATKASSVGRAIVILILLGGTAYAAYVQQPP